MEIASAIYALLTLCNTIIRAVRDPSWSTRNQEIRNSHVERIGEFARASREWTAEVEKMDGQDRAEVREAVDRGADHLRELWLRELAADGSYMGEQPGVKEPTMEVPLSVIDASYAALSGRRRDAELGQRGATINQGPTS